MDIDFTKIAPYLKDPLILIGFGLFLAFLFSRALLKSGIIPPIGAGRGAQILRLILLYGFILGILVTALGFGLKYRELSEAEQRAAVGLLMSELRHDIYVVRELGANTQSLASAASGIASTLRDKRFRINSGLFVDANSDPTVGEDADLYNKRFDWLEKSGLLLNIDEMRRFREQNEAIARMIDRILPTVLSLADSGGRRYAIDRSAFDANLPILRKVTIARTDQLGEVYAAASETREKYFRIANSVVEYMRAAREFCGGPTPNRTALGLILATERLTLRLLPALKQDLEEKTDAMNAQLERISSAVDSQLNNAERVSVKESSPQQARLQLANWLVLAASP